MCSSDLRFLPATKAQPKEMLPVVDKPLIQYAVEEAYAAGVREMIFVTGRHKRPIEDHFDMTFELEVALEQSAKHELLEHCLPESLKPEAKGISTENPLGTIWSLLNKLCGWEEASKGPSRPSLEQPRGRRDCPARCNMKWSHSLAKCGKFNSLAPSARWKIITEYELCEICFKDTHMRKQCKKHELNKSPVEAKVKGAGKKKPRCRLPSCPAPQGHYLEHCTEWLSLTLEERWEIVDNKQMCALCLRHSSKARECFADMNVGGRLTCGLDGCSGSHHRTLHRASVSESVMNVNAAPFVPAFQGSNKIGRAHV